MKFQKGSEVRLNFSLEEYVVAVSEQSFSAFFKFTIFKLSSHTNAFIKVIIFQLTHYPISSSNFKHSAQFHHNPNPTSAASINLVKTQPKIHMSLNSNTTRQIPVVNTLSTQKNTETCGIRGSNLEMGERSRCNYALVVWVGISPS